METTKVFLCECRETGRRVPMSIRGVPQEIQALSNLEKIQGVLRFTSGYFEMMKQRSK